MLLSQALPIAASAVIWRCCNRERSCRPMRRRSVLRHLVRAIEWYPVGRFVADATLMAGALAFLTLVLLGQISRSCADVLRKLIEKVFLKQLPALPGQDARRAEIEALTELALYAFPAATALSWLGGFLLNLYLARPHHARLRPSGAALARSRRR